MNKFVDFGKRSVELPAGCKDLIDVLQRAEQGGAPSLTTRLVDGLPGVTRHLDGLVEPGPKGKNLVITWHELNYLHLRNERGMLTALTVIHEKTHREESVRDVFDSAGLSPILDEGVAGLSVRVLRYPLPGAAAGMAELISELLRRGYGLAENVKLEVGSWEDDAS